MKRSHHMIDFIFPIALFFVFASTALVVLLLSANIYQSIVNHSESSFQTSTALSYITEKIRQNDAGASDNICLSEFDQQPALAISQTYGEKVYVTYIYESKGQLKEIFLQEGITAPADSGTTIMEIADLEMTQLATDLFQFTCTATDGSTASSIISTQSSNP